jgi:hypothetical protein
VVLQEAAPISWASGGCSRPSRRRRRCRGRPEVARGPAGEGHCWVSDPAAGCRIRPLDVVSSPWMSYPVAGCRIRPLSVGSGRRESDQALGVGSGCWVSAPDAGCRTWLLNVGFGRWVSDPAAGCQIRLLGVGFDIASWHRTPCIPFGR